MLKVMYSLVKKEKRKIVAHLSSIVHYPHAPPRKHFSLSHLGKERDPPPASSPPIFLSRTRFFNDSPALTYTCKKYTHRKKSTFIHAPWKNNDFREIQARYSLSLIFHVLEYIKIGQ